jgi:2-polyprenyl-3-methyl-5-hydroxy-6-metoxy-1,4-benzoquinol methylase
MERLKKEDYIHGGTQKDFYSKDEIETCNCPLCEKDNFTKIDTDRGLTIVKCNNCGLIYVNPRVCSSNENYFGESTTYFEEARLIFKGKKTHHRDRNYKSELEKLKKLKKTGKLLDVGSNMGFFLRKAKEYGYDCEGVEPSPSLSQIARENWGIDIHTNFLENLNLSKYSYDIITMIDVFEHVINPKELLKKCDELLKSDGILMIKVPNADYNYFKMQLGKKIGGGKKMDIWNMYEHVVHYTPKTLKNMVESCGFKIKKAFIPLPIHSPIWANLVGHYYQYPSPFILDWKRIIVRKIFYHIGKIGFILKGKTKFGPDLMFIIEKQTELSNKKFV